MNEQPILQFDVAYPERSKRWLLFFRWILIFPHWIVLYFLGLAVGITTAIAFFAILFIGRYPRGLWNFSLMVYRWSANVGVYLFFLRDEYPPFGEADYPVLYHLDYPERLSRWKIFVKGILLIPHLFVLYFLYLATAVVIFIAWWAVLIVGRYPRGMFGFVVGVLRWVQRVSVYAALLTDAYPPFTKDPVPSPTSALASPYGGGALPPRAW